MEVRIESMICVWDDAIPTMFLEFVNLLTLTTSEGELRKSVKEFADVVLRNFTLIKGTIFRFADRRAQ